MAQLD